MSRFASPRFLPRVLLLDAASGLGCGLLQLAVTEAMAAWTGLPAMLLTATGVFFLAYGGVVAVLALTGVGLRGGTALLVVGNLAWAVACIGLLLGGWVAPTRWGVAYVALQAVTVTVWALLQWMGLRRQAPQAAWAA